MMMMLMMMEKINPKQKHVESERRGRASRVKNPHEFRIRFWRIWISPSACFLSSCISSICYWLREKIDPIPGVTREEIEFCRGRARSRLQGCGLMELSVGLALEIESFHGSEFLCDGTERVKCPYLCLCMLGLRQKTENAPGKPSENKQTETSQHGVWAVALSASSSTSATSLHINIHKTPPFIHSTVTLNRQILRMNNQLTPPVTTRGLIHLAWTTEPARLVQPGRTDSRSWFRSWFSVRRSWISGSWLNCASQDP